MKPTKTRLEKTVMVLVGERKVKTLKIPSKWKMEQLMKGGVALKLLQIDLCQGGSKTQRFPKENLSSSGRL